MKKIYFLGILLLLASGAYAQSDSSKKALSISGYLEAYYGYDFGANHSHSRAPFLYSFNRNNEFNLNLGLLKASYSKERVRANLGLMAGTYSNANLAGEPATLRNIFEANVGFKASKTKNLWIDAGILPSHIGFESAIGKDCWSLTRSILADNSPYYESGAKISYTSANDKWLLSGMVLNGWQRIARTDGNNTPAFGHQITWKPNDKVTLNSSSLVGNDKPDSLRQMRYFHNFYGLFQITPAFGATVGFDIGAEQKSKGSADYNTWYSPVLILRAKLTDRLTLSARGEYYTDPNGVIIATGTQNGFQTYGYSLNADFAIFDNLLWRIEGRGFSSRDPIFTVDEKPSNSLFGLTSSLSVSF